MSVERHNTVQDETSPMEETYLTIAEVCAQLRVSRGVVHRAITSGRLEAIKVNGAKPGRVLIPASSYAKFLREQTVPAKAAG